MESIKRGITISELISGFIENDLAPRSRGDSK
jgi:hypothetical protein